MSSSPLTLDTIQGSILGLAIGDALGYPTEFRSREKILATFPPNGVTDFIDIKDPRWPQYPIIIGPRQPAGTYSDDTQMTLALAEGLLETMDDTHDLDARMNAVARHFVTWSNSPENNRAPGGTCMTGCSRLASGVAWNQAAVQNSKGCGSAMRVAPIGLLFSDQPERLLEIARASSILTHGHDAAIEGAAAAALLVAMAAQQKSPEHMWEVLMRECAPHSPDFESCLAKVPDMLDVDPGVALSNEGLGESWIAEEAVASALYCFWRHPNDFRACVLEAANTEGDSDSIACIAGSISGARLGLMNIPEHWRQNVEDSPLLHTLGRRIHDAIS